MTHRIVTDPIEYRDIHAAVCRARRAELACGTCYELAERAERAIRRAAVTVVSEAA